MTEYLKGLIASIIVNLLTILGWMYIGAWIPAVVNVLLALLVLGFYGLEDKWAFPMGYWTVELLAIVFWIDGMGWMLQLGSNLSG